MTIVLVSIADNGKSIVMAADRMLTIQDMTYQYEHDSAKWTQLGDYAIGYAGITVFANDIISNKYHTNKPIKELVKEIANYYKEYRLAIFNTVLLESIGLNIKVFNSNPQKFPPFLQERIYGELSNFKLGIELIICGFDQESAKIYEIGEYGLYSTAHAIGYAAIGIGQTHVMNHYIVNGYRFDRSLNEAIYFAFQAKKCAEIASGVGKQTDICIFQKGQSLRFFDDDDDLMKELNDIYNYHVREKNKMYESSILPRIKKINLR